MSTLPEGYGDVQIKPSRNAVDEVTSQQHLAKDPNYRAFFDALHHKRQIVEAETLKSSTLGDSVGTSKGGHFKLTAEIPATVFGALLECYGPEWVYLGGLREWLSRHPEYKVGRTTVRS